MSDGCRTISYEWVDGLGLGMGWYPRGVSHRAPYSANERTIHLTITLVPASYALVQDRWVPS